MNILKIGQNNTIMSNKKADPNIDVEIPKYYLVRVLAIEFPSIWAIL